MYNSNKTKVSNIVIILVCVIIISSCGNKESETDIVNDSFEITKDNSATDVAMEDTIKNEIEMIEQGKAETLSKEVWESVDGYPVTANSEYIDWSKLSWKTRYKILNMPGEMLKSMSTEELVNYVLNYPDIHQVFSMFNTYIQGLNTMYDRSNILREYCRRDDADSIMFEKYKEIDDSYDKTGAEEMTDGNEKYGDSFTNYLLIHGYLSWRRFLLDDSINEQIYDMYRATCGRDIDEGSDPHYMERIDESIWKDYVEGKNMEIFDEEEQLKRLEEM